MQTRLTQPVTYSFCINDERIILNEYLEKKCTITFLNEIICQSCNATTKKSYNQGFCYQCFMKLAACDTCIMSPEKCHFFEGTCREPEWGEKFCMQSHYVYLANSSGVKVGITRGTQVPTRWIDQGAIQALPILKVQTRQQSGLFESLFKQHLNDKTNWRAMLKNEVSACDLGAVRDALFTTCAEDIEALTQKFGFLNVQKIKNVDVTEIDYPVLEYPAKVTSLNLEKLGKVEGVLKGIKGQYLILEHGVINIRNLTGYHIQLEIDA